MRRTKKIKKKVEDKGKKEIISYLTSKKFYISGGDYCR
jgi:hypothetical protein